MFQCYNLLIRFDDLFPKISQLRGLTQGIHTAKGPVPLGLEVTQRQSDDFFLILGFKGGRFQGAYPNMSLLSFQPVL